jgi:hypothetical protein
MDGCGTVMCRLFRTLNDSFRPVSPQKRLDIPGEGHSRHRRIRPASNTGAEHRFVVASSLAACVRALALR